MTNPGQCPCGAEWATVEISTELGSTKAGRRCAGIVVMLAQLIGLTTKRRPLLKAVK